MHLLFVLTIGKTLFFENVLRFAYAGTKFEVVFAAVGQSEDVLAVAAETGENAVAFDAHEVYAVESFSAGDPWSGEVNCLLFSDGTHDKAIRYVAGDGYDFYIRPDRTAVMGQDAFDVIGVWNSAGTRVVARVENPNDDFDTQTRTMLELQGLEPPRDLAQLTPEELENW